MLLSVSNDTTFPPSLLSFSFVFEILFSQIQQRCQHWSVHFAKHGEHLQFLRTFLRTAFADTMETKPLKFYVHNCGHSYGCGRGCGRYGNAALAVVKATEPKPC